MQSSVLNQRTLQICFLVVLALFVASYTQWEHGLWVAISVAAIVGPFSTALTMQKAANRMYGTMAGLLLSAVLQVYLRYEYHSIFILGIVMGYAIGFSAQQNYRFFIMLVTTTVCVNFGYMNLAFTPFEPISFLVSRMMAVFAGIVLFTVLQRGVFGDTTAQIELQEALKGAAKELQLALTKVSEGENSGQTILDIATTLLQRTSSFDELCKATPYAIAKCSRTVVAAHNIRRLKARSLSDLAEYAGNLSLQASQSRGDSVRLKLALRVVARYC